MMQGLSCIGVTTVTHAKAVQITAEGLRIEKDGQVAAYQRSANTSRTAWAMAFMVTGFISVCRIPMAWARF